MFSAGGENDSPANRHFSVLYPKNAIIRYAILKAWNGWRRRLVRPGTYQFFQPTVNTGDSMRQEKTLPTDNGSE
jgi:hypothetical protein